MAQRILTHCLTSSILIAALGVPVAFCAGEERKATAEPPAQAAKESVPAKPLPGSRLTVEQAIKGGFTFIAVASPVDGNIAEDGNNGIMNVSRDFKIARTLAGQAPGEQVRLFYHRVTSFPAPAGHGPQVTEERNVAAGEEVAWIVRQDDKGTYHGIKALPNTFDQRAAVLEAAVQDPENRATVIQAARAQRREPASDGELPAGETNSGALPAKGADRAVVAEALPPGAYIGNRKRLHTSQTFILSEVLAGKPPERRVFDVGYTWILPGERSVQAGEKVIWILGDYASYLPNAAPRNDGGRWGDIVTDALGRYTGLKALSDTPENRKLVVEMFKPTAKADAP